MHNKQIAAALLELADLLEISGENAFKVNAYRRASRTVENCRFPIAKQLDRLEELPGIGKGTAGVIEELVAAGSIGMLEELKSTLPPGLPELLKLPGLGPRSVHTLYKELDIKNMDELKEAAEKQKIRSLPGFGPKKEQKILEAIAQVQNRPERRLLHEALFVASHLAEQLKDEEEVLQMELAGSLRRRKETIKDIDFVIATVSPVELGRKIVRLPVVTEIIGQGETKVSVRVNVEGIEMGADFRLVTPAQFASALHHFTGSKEHNVRIRQRAKKYGLKVSEYGIFNSETDETMTFADEREFFAALDLPWIAPELREDRGEMERAEQDNLPGLIRPEEIRGDLHMHTLYSDGADSIKNMALAAKARGYEYIAITDHSVSLKVAGGLSVEELMEQWAEIERINAELEGIVILKGVEMDILPDGRLDYPDEILARMDFVIASIHSRFNQDEEAMTKRIIQAMENPYVNMIAHPTGRLLLRRDPYSVDVDRIFQAAKETGTILELNSNPHRLDLNDELIKKAKEEYGLTFAINTDAHSTAELGNIAYGVATARRGWLEPKDVLNTLPLHELLQRLKQKTGKSKAENGK
ncbi:MULTISPECIES: DNA polymerase/3'-5' exonuclease PolX [Thermoactinomyces]|uniref:DNA polymerase beta n=1 Tax=Thermoactinomyces daqus TaxID=1329516 RepID=A0A7W1XBT3_9BACL|nr:MULTISPECIES: DNA polymerase/3'-5' exonuclease PolX [Thermoactinomyces]MBA4543740.1 DNA polymerase/3'-5' exonuclease PolX [Thermoactinomyces daqus]MBH8608528.1 DNA polymerase/3'-5' exonuclease PolX [Thermoactinomyces sp. CICC 10521]